MPARRPSFLKRQKEQKRAARALEKRETRRARKEARSMGGPRVETYDQAGESEPMEDMEPSSLSGVGPK
jgi:hypothetical protein